MSVILKGFNKRKERVRSQVKDRNKSGKPRIVVTRSNKNIYAQIVNIEGNVLVQASSISFDEKISGVEKAKIVGKNIAELCKKANIDNVVFDKGAYNYNGRVKALASACRDSGLKF